MQADYDKYTQIIARYIEAYNRFDISGMLADMDNHVRFENISAGEINLATEGLEALKKQAQLAATLFSQRTQTVTGLTFKDDLAEVGIAYKGVLATALPNGLKAGDSIEMHGKSVFRFKDGKIVFLQDIS
ncbi:nuclear transport factor 2 family protein [Dyadobacter sandarakinus]|uniref:Nuclear transport factor 2 family protein n=1 Tax=Dyadobacter sandarakinus TaxID=2747268 RepID=A0ABX7I2S4_9BACT|nr:nuclear transport factor 2 family protein [Dyadobacter sandarakinus]QRQ99537.1 nuclear transport factor 2 family protein [Dyadobacter sandarakinus]